MQSLFSGHEPVGEAIASLQSRFADAAAGNGEGAYGNGITLGPNELLVDQVRGIASIPGRPDDWTDRDGRRLVRNDTEVGRLMLAYVVGPTRLLSANDFVQILTWLAGGARTAIREDDLAQFVNLVAAEPARDPGRTLPVWVAAAYKLATSAGREHFARKIPGLASGHDELYAEIPPGASHSEDLQPASEEPTLAAYKARLLASALPDTAGEVQRLSTDEDREAAFEAHTPELEAYVRENLLSRAGETPS